mmetsp:Transcript_26546/g.56524  ORF Transcript_26546/g.56524 Transcript_26546/m.56524 type:complete len:207 (+) Transcript_26546:385-1005(+)
MSPTLRTSEDHQGALRLFAEASRDTAQTTTAGPKAHCSSWAALRQQLAPHRGSHRHFDIKSQAFLSMDNSLLLRRSDYHRQHHVPECLLPLQKRDLSLRFQRWCRAQLSAVLGGHVQNQNAVPATGQGKCQHQGLLGIGEVLRSNTNHPSDARLRPLLLNQRHRWCPAEFHQRGYKRIFHRRPWNPRNCKQLIGVRLLAERLPLLF